MLKFLLDNQELFIPIISTVASAFCAVTPTPKKDTKWGMVYELIEILALNIFKAKQQ